MGKKRTNREPLEVPLEELYSPEAHEEGHHVDPLGFIEDEPVHAPAAPSEPAVPEAHVSAGEGRGGQFKIVKGKRVPA